MSAVFDIMPGLTMPISEVTDFLAHLWFGEAEEKKDYNRYRACQMNLILHFGKNTTPEKALECFNTAVKFAQKYPCRIIVLCPQSIEEKDILLESKVFSQCYMGEGLKQMQCYEALILGYLIEEITFLENQVSIWLEDDLPTYYWLNEVRPKVIQNRYLHFIESSQAVIYDSALEPESFKQIPWTYPDKLSDLAWSRLLPVRQSMGQFLSSYAPEILTEGLTHIDIAHSEKFTAEAKQLKIWQEDALKKCDPKLNIPFNLTLPKDHEKTCLDIHWHYKKNKYFNCRFCYSSHSGHIKANLCGEEIDLPLQVAPLAPSLTFANACFF